MVSPLSPFFSHRVTAHAASSSSSSDPQLQAALEFFRGLDIGVHTVEDMKKVQELDLRPTWIDQDGLRRKVASPGQYSFSTAQFGNEDLRHLVYLENLHTLNVSWNFIGDSDAEHLSKLTNLQSLDVSHNSIIDTGCKHLSKLTNLRFLNINNNFVVADGAEHLSKLTNLQSLIVNRNIIGTIGAQHLSKLTNLQSLNISENEIGDDGAEHLSNLTNLQSLNISENKIGDNGAEHLSKLINLQSLDVSWNNIGAAGVESLKNLAMHALLVDLKGIDDSDLMAMISSIRESKRSLVSILFDHVSLPPLSPFDSHSITAHAATSSSSSDTQLQAALEFFRKLNIGVHTVEDMKKVQVLDLSLRWIDQRGIRRRVSCIREYLAYYKQFGSLNLHHLIYLENLHTLNLSYQYIYGENAKDLSKMTNLRTLVVYQINSSHVSSGIVESLKNLAMHGQLVKLKGIDNPDLQKMIIKRIKEGSLLSRLLLCLTTSPFTRLGVQRNYGKGH